MTCPDLRCALLGLLGLVLSGCPGDDTSSESGPDDSTTTATTGTSATSTPSTSAGTDDSGSGSGPGTPCGETTCGPDEYCDYGVNSCGEAEFDEGTCMPRPEGCDASYFPVCGCDGQVHSNACEANAAGVDVDGSGACDPPEGTFACGFRFCDVGVAYCQVGVSDIGGEPDAFNCMVPAQPCAEETLVCDCLTEEPCFEFSCEESPDGGVEIVCPGG